MIKGCVFRVYLSALITIITTAFLMVVTVISTLLKGHDVEEWDYIQNSV